MYHAYLWNLLLAKYGTEVRLNLSLCDWTWVSRGEWQGRYNMSSLPSDIALPLVSETLRL